MAHENMRSKILALNKLYGSERKIEAGRFDTQTNTLYSDKKVVSKDEPVQKYSHPELIFEEKEYNDIINGRVCCAVIRNDDVKIHSNITIRESKNLLPTGRIVVKEITHIITPSDSKGIKEGYRVIGW